ncbi:MAG: AraC family transcriptional regulator [Acidobacteria bacterium]|nr:AraC family transcriptional regulator [Acidobacteriota bacterium]
MASRSQHTAAPHSLDRKNTTPRVFFDPTVGPARRILRQSSENYVQQHERRSPAPALEPWIQHYWLVGSSLPSGVTQTVKTLPHPNIQLVFGAEGVQIHGIHPRLFQKTLSGTETAFGVKFRAGGFRPFFDRPLSSLRGSTIPAQSVFGPQIDTLLRDSQTAAQKIAAANDFFASRIAQLKPPCEKAVLAVRACEESPAIRCVAGLAAHMGMGERSLERLFREHIGVGPKWVILRYRIHELIERINALSPNQEIDWVATALELGYFDQSHMIRDFRTLTGLQPEVYRRQSTMDKEG